MIAIVNPVYLVFPLLALFAQASCSADITAPPVDSVKENALPYKFTVGSYKFSSGANAIDVNLRQTSMLGNIWIGYYESKDRDEHQGRAGWDQTFDFEKVRFSPSLQIASQGFAAFSAQVETGQSWFVGAGIGRTNLRPYWNLNFDPNDSYTLSSGVRYENGESLSLMWVRDNRQNPDQRHLHMLYRTPRPDGERLTFDVLYKKGIVDDVLLDRWGLSVAYDWPKFFVRVAYDPIVNFTSDNMWRVAIGSRF
ncbi:hypothetical protein [Sulfurirhabdus autotrophica]|uniref:YaiO family outer membrane beta-barrel protein n=1 Tax=Sulfurirhabdus autotrophica TaxID=1706046 RepID=A0A4R3YCE7_9PROT|nr:hypothetical protein [Sulfurirhabdus autotrophica]TCV89686.1 hypothetical protein EDC63_102207 [Sulfurirhabdus autotrophica]